MRITSPADGLSAKRNQIPGLGTAPVVCVGAGLTGSALAEVEIGASLMLIIDDDVVEEATRLAPTFAEAEVGALKVEVLAGRRARFASWAQTIPLAMRVEQLGGGFWRWVADRNGLVFDTTDRASTHAQLAGRAKQYGLPLVQTGVWDWEACVRFFPPAEEAACWRCLGLPEGDQRQSCLEGEVFAGLPGDPPSTRSHPAAAAACSAMALGIARSEAADGRAAVEWRLDLRCGKVLQSTLLRAQDCDHARKSQQPLRLPLGGEAPLAGAFRAARAELGGEVELTFERGVAPQLGCNDCGTLTSRSWRVLGGPWTCEQCGGRNMIAAQADIKDRLAAAELGNATAGELGLPRWPELEFARNGRRVAVVLEGDAPALLGEAWRDLSDG